MRVKKELMQAQVGAFVIIGLALLMLVIFMLGSEKRLFETHYQLICRFTNISGLRAGAPVQLAGIKVGTVNRILFDDSLEEKKVIIELSISTRYKERIRADSEASIVTQGLLGDKMVFVSVGSPNEPVLKSGEELKSQAPTGFSQLLEKGEGLVDGFAEISAHIEDILGEVRSGKGVLHSIIYDDSERLIQDIQELSANINQMSAHFEQVAQKINQGDGTLGALINDATLFNDMKTLLGKANRNKLIRAVVRETLRTKEDGLLQK